MTTRELLLSCWRLDPLAVIVCAAAAVAYAAKYRARARRRGVAFAAAVVVFALALLSPIGQLADGYLFSAHMLQHLLLVLIVPPLALMGLATSPGGVRRVPAVVMWGLGVGAMWLWHAPTLCDAASQNALVHRAQEASLLAMGTAFWWPVLGPSESARLPPLAGALYLFTACAACTLLGVAITFSPVAVCSVFAHPVDHLGVMPLVRDGWGLSAQRDQQIGGLLMWVPACLVYGAGILGQLARMYRADDGTCAPGRSS
jgi:putative membrane protein